jgi:hypothetical protein
MEMKIKPEAVAQTAPSIEDLHLQHLLAEINRLDIRIRFEINRWQQAGQDPLDTFRGLYISDAEASELIQREIGTSWGQTVDPSPEGTTWIEAERKAEERSAHVNAQLQERGCLPRLLHLKRGFNLSDFELDAFLLCLAPSLDLRYERLYAYLQDDVTRKRPTLNLIFNLLSPPGLERLKRYPRLNDRSPLIRFELLRTPNHEAHHERGFLNLPLEVDGAVMSWLLGTFLPHEAIRPHCEIYLDQEQDVDHDLVGDILQGLIEAVTSRRVLVFHGPDSLRRRTAARVLAAHVCMPVLYVDVPASIEQGLDPHRILLLALRDAQISSALLYLEGWDQTQSGTRLDSHLVEGLRTFQNLLILSGDQRWQPHGVERIQPISWFNFPVPPYAFRRKLWSSYLEPAQVEEEILEEVASQFVLTSDRIRDAAQAARDYLSAPEEMLTNADLMAAARRYSNPGLAKLAKKISPRFHWGDIILPEDQVAILREIVATVRGRPLVLETWRVGEKLASSAGVTVLFAGPPGTGKTMAAEVIAGELGLDLYKIDLSTVVSKYIGETEKNLERVFREASMSNAILFFDEADALFGKRSEVRDSHDRYANIEISYLLQRMEAYDGVTILATNLRANLDEAFTRRLQFSVDFPFPEQGDRLKIWQTLFPPDVPREQDLDLAYLARAFKLAGGNIRNILVGASFLAASDGGRVSMDHLLHSTRRELQKMGRLLHDEESIIEDHKAQSKTG